MKIKVNINYYDQQLKRDVKEGEILNVTTERANLLKAKLFQGKPYAIDIVEAKAKVILSDKDVNMINNTQKKKTAVKRKKNEKNKE